MTANRERLSASVEAGLLEAGRVAVAEGRAPNLSAWVNDALRRQAEHDPRMQALDAFIERYEAQHGAITDDEMRDATRRARSRATIVRTPDPGGPGARPRRPNVIRPADDQADPDGRAPCRRPSHARGGSDSRRAADPCAGRLE
jgi:hypothetical protein